MVFEEILPYLPYVSIVSLLIALGIIIYHFGKWRQRSDADREEVKKKLEAIMTKVDRIPEELLSKSVDVYKMWEKIKENPEATKKRRNEDEQ